MRIEPDAIARNPRPLSDRQGLLNNRAALILVSLFCLAEGVWSWISINKPPPRREHLIDLVFFAVVIFIAFIAAVIAYRSRFWADKVVFGAVAGAFAVILLQAAPLPPAATLAVNVAYALLWTIAACTSLLTLALEFRASHKA